MQNKFKEYLDNKGVSPLAFRKACLLSLNTIYKLYRGEKVRIDTAKRIVRVTKKEITLEDLGHEPRRSITG